MRNQYVLVVCALAMSMPGVVLAQDSTAFDAPLFTTADHPVAIPADHAAIIESEKIVARINSDEFFKLQKQVQAAKLTENLAVAEQATAEAQAKACQANKVYCRNGLTQKTVKSSESETATPVRFAEAYRQPQSEIAQQREQSRADEERATLSSIRLVAIIGNDVIVQLKGERQTLRVGSIIDDVKLVSISGDKSATFKGTKSATTRTLHVSAYGTYPTNHIKPIDDSKDAKVNQQNQFGPMPTFAN